MKIQNQINSPLINKELWLKQSFNPYFPIKNELIILYYILKYTNIKQSEYKIFQNQLLLTTYPKHTGCLVVLPIGYP
jgi:hypothetical protein